MPFIPSSPIRMYPGHRPRKSLTAESDTSASKIQETKRNRRSFPGANVTAAPAISTVTVSADDSQSQQPVQGEPAMSGNLELGKRSEYSVEESTKAQRDLEKTDHAPSVGRITANGDANEEHSDPKSPSHHGTRPQSMLFDNVSESEYSVEEDAGPVIGRASSVRASKPLIIENKPTRLSKLEPQSPFHAISNSRSLLKAERASGHQAEVLPTMVEEDSSQRTMDHNDLMAVEGPGEAPSPKNPSQSSKDATLPVSESSVGQNGFPNTTPSYAVFSSALPTGSTLHSVRPSIVSPEEQSPISNETPQVSAVPNLSRAMSAPLPLPGKGLSRRVSIRPADIITKDHHDHKAFRESVVTTPYPTRISTEENSMNSENLEREAFHDQALSSGRKGKSNRESRRIPSPKLTGKRDRFPSPERPEVLSLNLGIFNQPQTTVSIEIHIEDKGVFDDEAFFKEVRSAYENKLLLSPRRLFTTVRRLQYVRMSSQSTGSHLGLDGDSFLRHLQNPQVGRKNKTWVSWLRNHNTVLPFSWTQNLGGRGAEVRHIHNLSHLSTRARGGLPHSRHSSQSTKSLHTDRDINNANDCKRPSTSSDTSSFYFAYSPALPKLPFLKTWHGGGNPRSKTHSPTSAMAQPAGSSPCRSFIWPSIHTTQSGSAMVHQNNNDGNDNDCEMTPRGTRAVPTIHLHHTFSIPRLALLTFLNVLFALLCAVAWIIFGVPGSRPGTTHAHPQLDASAPPSGQSDWRVSSQARVLTGAVIGLVTLLLGCVVEAAVLCMSWLVL